MPIEENIKRSIEKKIESYDKEIEDLKYRLGSKTPTSTIAQNLVDQLATLLAKRDALEKHNEEFI